MKSFVGKAQEIWGYFGKMGLNRFSLWFLPPARWVQGGFAAERRGADACKVPPYLVQLYPLLWDPRLRVLQAEDPKLGLHQVGGIFLHRWDVKSDDSEVEAVIARWDGICKKAAWFYFFVMIVYIVPSNSVIQDSLSKGKFCSMIQFPMVNLILLTI